MLDSIDRSTGTDRPVTIPARDSRLRHPVAARLRVAFLTTAGLLTLLVALLMVTRSAQAYSAPALLPVSFSDYTVIEQPFVGTGFTVTVWTPGQGFIGYPGTSSSICGTGTFSQATSVTYNGIEAPLDDMYETSPGVWCTYSTPPIADPPDSINGPLNLKHPAGDLALESAYTADPEAQIYNSGYIWTDAGKFWAAQGAYLGTATSVLRNNVAVSFTVVSPIEILVPVTGFASSAVFTVTTPSGNPGTSASGSPEFQMWNGIPATQAGAMVVAPYNGMPTIYATFEHSGGLLSPLNGFVTAIEPYLTKPPVYAENLNDHMGSLVLTGPNTGVSTGTLTTSDSATFEITTTWSLEPFSTRYVGSYEIVRTDGGGMGGVRLISYLDQDVWNTDTDMVAFPFPAGDENFMIMSPDKRARVGIALTGYYTDTPGRLENATWVGFAAAAYDDPLRYAIQDGSVFLSPTVSVGTPISGFVTTSNMDSACVTPVADATWWTGNLYDAAGCDVGIAMGWDGDPSSTRMVVSAVYHGAVSDPTKSRLVGFSGLNVTANGNAVALSPSPFVSTTTVYTALQEIEGTASSVVLTPTSLSTPERWHAIVTHADGSKSICTLKPLDCPLKTGFNSIRVTTIAANFVDSLSYTVNVTRAAAPPLLDGLAVVEAQISPVFSAPVNAYTATVPYTVATATVAVTLPAGATSSVAVSVTSLLRRTPRLRQNRPVL